MGRKIDRTRQYSHSPHLRHAKVSHDKAGPQVPIIIIIIVTLTNTSSSRGEMYEVYLRNIHDDLHCPPLKLHDVLPIL